MSEPAVAIVVVTHNSAIALPPLLRSAAEENARNARALVVVDNASTDGSAALVARTVPSAKVLSNEHNFGFAAAVNRGVRESSSELVLLANPDVEWKPGTIETLAAAMLDRPRVAAVCPRLVHPDGAAQPSARRFPTHTNIWFSRQSPLRRLKPEAYTLADPIVPSRIEAVAATFMLVRRSAFDAVGGMDERYFLYVEDTDLCKRWSDAGYEVWLDPRATVTHHWQGGSRRDRALRRHHRRSMRQYFRTHHARKRVRNAILFAALGILDAWDRVPGH